MGPMADDGNPNIEAILYDHGQKLYELRREVSELAQAVRQLGNRVNEIQRGTA